MSDTSARKVAAANWRTRLRQGLTVTLRPHSKLAFLRSLPRHARVLDVGCGNNSPRETKLLRPDVVYTGIDVADYNQESGTHHADRYLLVPPAQFAAAISEFAGQMDAVVSSHNLEHCDDPAAVLRAILAALTPGGLLYLAFPSEASVRFPSRRGCLNFHDDPSHQHLPRWGDVLAMLETEPYEVLYAAQRYRPRLLAFTGLLLEPLGALTGRNMPGGSTWALYGFESILWVARR